MSGTTEALTAVLDLNDKPFVRGADNAVKALDKVSKKSKETSDVLDKLQGYAAKYFAVEKVLAFGKALTDTSGKFEMFGSILTNALQSGSGSRDQLRNLTDFAASTPNQLDELTGSFIKFVNRGLVPTKQQLTNFGDLAASQGKGFDQLTEAILDAQSGEFERLKEFGVRASKSGNQVTLSFKGVSQTVKATSGDITEAIQKFGQLTGVAGSMSAVAQTQEGMVSNLSDQYDRLMVALGEAGVSGAFKGVLMVASELLSVTTDLIANSPVDDLRNQQTEINGLVGAIALANDNETVRLSLIQQLNQKYPEFLGKLDAESVTTDLLARRLADVNDQYEKKILLALNEEKLKKNADALTNSIRQQTNALQILAKEAGMAIEELTELKPEQRIALAKKISDKNKTGFRPSYFGQSLAVATDNLPQILEAAAARQKELLAEKNELTKENATRQANLTKATVANYDTEIKKIQEQIRLKQTDAKVGAAEIKRLQEAKRIAQGIAAPKDTTVVGGSRAGSKANPKTSWTVVEVLDRAIKGIQEDIQTKRSLNIDVPAETHRLLERTQGQLDRIKGTAEKESSLKVTGKSAIDVNIAGGSDRFGKYVDGMRSRVEELKKYGSLEFYQLELEKIRKYASDISLKGLEVDSSVLSQVAQYAGQLGKVGEAQKEIDQVVNKESSTGSKTKWALPGLAGMSEYLKQVEEGVNNAKAFFDVAKVQLAASAAGLLAGIGESIGQGENPLRGALQGLLNILGDFLIQLGSAILLAGQLQEGAAALSGPLAPLFALQGAAQVAAGLGLIVGGGVVKGLGASLEGGGLATGRAFVEVGESTKALSGGGEFIAPVQLGADLIAKRIMNTVSGSRASVPSAETRSELLGREILSGMGGDGTLTARISGNDLLVLYERAVRRKQSLGNG